MLNRGVGSKCYLLRRVVLSSMLMVEMRVGAEW